VVTAFLAVALVLSGCGTTPGAPPQSVATTVDPLADRASVPQVNRLTFAEAKERLEAAGFKVVAPADVTDRSVVISTSPSGGAFIPRGTQVEVKVGPPEGTATTKSRK